MHQVDIVLIEGFPYLSLSLLTEPMRLANRESVSQRFAWRLLSTDGGDVSASSGMAFRCDSALDAQRADAVIVLSAYHPESALKPTLINWLKRRSAVGELMGCVDTAAMLFASAGLLTHQPAAVHHEAIAGFRSEFRDDWFVDRLYTFTPTRCSSAGGVATIDMTLALIAHFEDDRLAQRVAEILNHQPSEDEQQGLFGREWDVPRFNRHLTHSVEIMIASIDEPRPITDIAARVGVPVWRLRRLFLKYLRQTPANYYRKIRLGKAQNMLRNSHASVGAIATACGFENLETFSRAYRREHGKPPSRDREWKIH